MIRKIETDLAPAAIGPYSQGMCWNGLIFLSGQIGLDPKSGELQNENITVETHQVLTNIQSLLASQSLTMADVLKCSVFVTNINDFATINEIYAGYFTGDRPPARELIQVAALPKNASIEISVIAAERK